MSIAAVNAAGSFEVQSPKPVKTVEKVVTIEPVENTTAKVQASGTQPVMTAGNSDMKNSENGQEQANEKNLNMMKHAVSSANSKLRQGQSRTKCEFSYHEGTKRVSIKIMDEETNEVIREIPPEETLEMVEKMWELAGILVDERR